MSASVAAKHLGLDQNAVVAQSGEAEGTKRELRVLQVFSVLSVGGAETWLMALLKYFNESADSLPVKVKCDILLTGGEPSVFDEEAKSLGARLYYVPFSRRHPIRFLREFRRILKAGHYDVIHDHQDYIAGLHFAMGLGRLPGVRIAHVHNPSYQRAEYGKGLMRRSVRPLGSLGLGYLATHVMGTSRQIVSEYGFDGLDSCGIALGAACCGFDVTSYEGNREQVHAELCRVFGWRPSAKIILFVGRLDAGEVIHLGRTMSHKNPAFALEVAKECISSDPDVRLLMAGAGDNKRREFGSQIREWGLEEKIKLLGVRSDVPRLMLGSDLLLFPSLAEGLGMVVVEAQAAGLRVLASGTTPRECSVVPGLVNFLSLDLTARDWADEVGRVIDLGRVESSYCLEAIRRSPFSIENSAANLMKLYRGGIAE
jgi:glycosyltransferase involved in cell wall biosynthesis